MSVFEFMAIRSWCENFQQRSRSDCFIIKLWRTLFLWLKAWALKVSLSMLKNQWETTVLIKVTTEVRVPAKWAENCFGWSYVFGWGEKVSKYSNLSDSIILESFFLSRKMWKSAEKSDLDTLVVYRTQHFFNDSVMFYFYTIIPNTSRNNKQYLRFYKSFTFFRVTEERKNLQSSEKKYYRSEINQWSN